MTHIQGFRFSAGMVLLLDVELSGRGKQGLDVEKPSKHITPQKALYCNPLHLRSRASAVTKPYTAN